MESFFSITEEVIPFSQREYDAWLRFDPELMPEKLADSFRKDIREGRKSVPEFHHFAANIARKYLEKRGYTTLLSEMSGDEYKLFQRDPRILRYVSRDRYENFTQTYKTLRKGGIIKQNGGEPDLFVSKGERAFFIEAKRIGPGNYKDRLRENQKVIISLIKLFLNLETQIFAVVHEDLIKNYQKQRYSWNLELIVSKP